MCRFVAYLGKKPIILNQILDKPENSLVNQSRRAKEGKLGLNADGFGIGWYDHLIDQEPALFKSIQPAWNDPNLKYISSKIRSNCFVGHVRASTVGDVNTFNCHPFTHQNFLFVHNGTIQSFDSIKRRLLGSLNDKLFELIKGQTDSEHFFALLMDLLYQNTKSFKLKTMKDVMLLAIKKVTDMQKKLLNHSFSRINSVLTNGEQMIATRYISDSKENSLSLYYTLGDYIDNENNSGMMHSTKGDPGAILIASEPLTDFSEEWQEIPTNHILMVGSDLKTELQPIPDTYYQ